MWPLLSFMSWLALATFGVEGSPQISPPEMIERMCRESEATYDGPLMPQISAPIFSGSGCPSLDNRLAYNYAGMWRCLKDDLQFVIPDLRLRVEGGGLAKADCVISFRVYGLGEGWQVALGEGLLLPDVELSRNSIVRFSGAASWEGGRLTVSSFWILCGGSIRPRLTAILTTEWGRPDKRELLQRRRPPDQAAPS
jgi:hypothetical protein